MTADNVLHFCSPGTKCAIQIAAPAFELRLEAALVDLVEKHEPRGDVEVKARNRGRLTGKPQSEKDVMDHFYLEVCALQAHEGCIN
jgi:hypothetical protein